MCGQSDRFVLPRRETKKRADAEPTKPGIVTPLRTIEPPIEIALRTGGVHLRVNLAIVGFLVDDETFRSGRDERQVIRPFPSGRLRSRSRRNPAQERERNRPDNPADELRMLARHEQDLPKASRRQVPRFGDDLLELRVTRRIGLSREKSTIPAIVDALVGQIKRREQPHRSPKILARERLGLCAMLSNSPSDFGAQGPLRNAATAAISSVANYLGFRQRTLEEIRRAPSIPQTQWSNVAFRRETDWKIRARILAQRHFVAEAAFGPTGSSALQFRPGICVRDGEFFVVISWVATEHHARHNVAPARPEILRPPP